MKYGGGCVFVIIEFRIDFVHCKVSLEVFV